ncbi:MAG TPA: CCA tRNA nucleotidyltransferase [candidate division Zixibacteria bacterium]|nr:CCA tRNA nucleotidyltransferase [candidate division Zixibacteria bacterium]
MHEKMETVLATVMKQVTPKDDERAKMNALAKKLERRVASASKRLGVKAVVRVEGSVAKDTWLSGELDVDVFMRVSRSIPRESLGTVCLRIARKATEGSKQIERFAEHPYLEAIVEGVRVNVVPCYAVKRGEWLSATDRTPFHTDYVNEHLSKRMRGEVRLLKKFMKGTGVYGAEIKVGGFSGYLCELLILHYKTFTKTLEAFAKHRQRIVVDIEGFYENRENELLLLFDEPLVVVDPVDRARNVASAVQTQKLYNFIAAAQAFLRRPNAEFFYPTETTAFTAEKMEKGLKNRGSKIVFVVFDGIKAVPDVLWGQLYKSQRSLRKLVQLSDFKILRDLAWSDEKNSGMFIFELEDCCISPVKKHLGPPLDKQKECEKFVTKHMNSKDTVCGPYVENGRWVVLVRRKPTDVCDLFRQRLEDGGRSAGVAEGISQVLKKGFRVLANEEISDVYETNAEFALFLTEFLQGKPRWLESRSTRER